jgi:tetratricopeptide (TPR) repeat protein
MMARTPSQPLWTAAHLAAAAIVLSFTPIALSEDEIQITAPKSNFENPFLPREAKPALVAEEPQSTRRDATTYQNPFANMSKAPPIDPSLRPGPVSRWQRPALPVAGSQNKSSLLSPITRSPNESWDQLPPELGKAHRTSDTATALNAHDPLIRAAAPQVTQPVSVVSGEVNELPRPNTFAEPAGADSIDATDINSPLKSPGRISSAFDLASDVPKTAAETIAPDLIANCSDTPQDWLTQAQQAAPSADSADELATVIDLCDRGIHGNPPAGVLSSLRTLSAWAHNRRGETLADAQHTDEALKDFQAAIAMDANCSLALHNRAVTLAQRNQYAAALRDFNRVIELNPGLAVAYRNRAELLAALGRSEEAIADYNRALESMPEDAALFRARAHAHQRLGNFSSAATDIARAIELAPRDPDGFTQRGNLAAEQGKFEQACADFRHAIEIDPNWAEACRSLAWLQATCPDRRFRDSEQALAMAEQAAKLSQPDDYLIFDTLAAAQASAGHFPQAIELEQKSIAAAPREASTSLEQRLAMYQQGKSFSAGSAPSAVRTASHESRAASPPRKSPPPRQIVR